MRGDPVELDAEWKLLQHKLRTACRCTSLTLTGAWRQGEPSGGIEAWVPGSTLEGVTTAFTGSLPQQLLGTPAKKDDGTLRHEMLLVSLNTSRALLRRKRGHASPDELERGFDSLMEKVDVPPTTNMHMQDRIVAMRPAHRFTIFDSSKVTPIMRVEFTLDNLAERDALKRRHIIKCQGCQRGTPAAVYCATEGFALCHACDAEMHAHPLRRKCERMDINDLKAQLHMSPPICTVHREKATWYCVAEEEVVCVHCKMMGKYAAGHARDHAIHPLSEAYDLALDQHTPLDGRDPAGHLREQLVTVHKGMKAMEDERKRVCDEVDAAAAAAKQQVGEIVESSIHALRSCEEECSRRLEQVEAADAFLEYAKNCMPPEGYLRIHHQHQAYR